MGIEMQNDEGHTLMSEEEKAGLLIKTITTHEELDELEQLNIESALAWSLQRKFKKERIFTEKYIKDLHTRMFNKVWDWAGQFRHTEKNIGVPWVKVGIELNHLLGDALYWIDNEVYPPDEIAIRFKHRIVIIHCFSNGNGRHSRMMADIIAESIFRRPPFTWHHSNMVEEDETRATYIEALHEADKGNMQPLIDFARG